jgi:hypothetical protein
MANTVAERIFCAPTVQPSRVPTSCGRFECITIEKDEGTSAILGQVIVARAETSRSVTGIVDGLSSRAIESEDDKQNRSKLLRDLGYKKNDKDVPFCDSAPCARGTECRAHI